MTIVLFAIIGSTINASTGYWICFAIYSIIYIVESIYSVIKEG